MNSTTLSNLYNYSLHRTFESSTNHISNVWNISNFDTTLSLQFTFENTAHTNCTKRSIYDSWNSQISGVMDVHHNAWSSLYCPYCRLNEYVLNGACISCAAGTTNEAGDDPLGGSNTTCDVTYCGANERVSNNACVACDAGYENAAGDDASGSDTTCTSNDGANSDSSFPDYGIALVVVGVVGVIAVVIIVAISNGACAGSTGSQVTQSDTGSVEMQGP